MLIILSFISSSEDANIDEDEISDSNTNKTELEDVDMDEDLDQDIADSVHKQDQVNVDYKASVNTYSVDKNVSYNQLYSAQKTPMRCNLFLSAHIHLQFISV